MSTGPEPFDLRGLIRRVMDDNDTVADPGALADLVLREIKAKDSRAALEACLRQFVRQVFSEQRSATTISEIQPGGVTASWKREGLREMWRRSLLDRLDVSGARSEWKFLKDCTRDDLLRLAEFRREQAARNNAKARQFATLASLLDEHGAKAVGDLPPDVLMRTLGRAA